MVSIDLCINSESGQLTEKLTGIVFHDEAGEKIVHLSTIDLPGIEAIVSAPFFFLYDHKIRFTNHTRWIGNMMWDRISTSPQFACGLLNLICNHGWNEWNMEFGNWEKWNHGTEFDTKSDFLADDPGKGFVIIKNQLQLDFKYF